MLVAMSRVVIYSSGVVVKVLNKRMMVANARGCEKIIGQEVTYRDDDDKFGDFVMLIAGGGIVWKVADGSGDADLLLVDWSGNIDIRGTNSLLFVHLLHENHS